MLISQGNLHLISQFYKAIDLGPTQILCWYKGLSKIHKVISISYCYRATQVTFQMFSPGREGECVCVNSGRAGRYSGAEKSGPPHLAASARVRSGKRPKRTYK